MRRLLVLPAALAAAAVSLTACGSDTDSSAAVSSTPASASASVAAPSTTAESTTSSAPESETDEVAPAPTVTDEIVDGPPPAATQTQAPKSPLGSDACAFATEDSLMAALRSTPAFTRTASPTGFRRIQCSTPFALASTSGTPQSSGVLFQRTGQSWTVLDVGSAIQCAQYGVTAAQAPALEGCVV